jgi:hypothetical protein
MFRPGLSAANRRETTIVVVGRDALHLCPSGGRKIEPRDSFEEVWTGQSVPQNISGTDQRRLVGLEPLRMPVGDRLGPQCTFEPQNQIRRNNAINDGWQFEPILEVECSRTPYRPNPRLLPFLVAGSDGLCNWHVANPGFLLAPA